MDASFDWDEANVRHIARHRVTPGEVEQAFANGVFDIDFDVTAGEDRWTGIGHTDSGRFLLVIWTMRGQATRTVTAYDASRWMVDLYLGR